MSETSTSKTQTCTVFDVIFCQVHVFRDTWGTSIAISRNADISGHENPQEHVDLVNMSLASVDLMENPNVPICRL